MATANVPRASSFHPLPVIGHPPAFYDRHIKEAEQSGNVHARASHKVGYYVTAALDPKRSWDDRVHCLKHAMKHYCSSPPDADGPLAQFYTKLCELLRRHGGVIALQATRKFHEDLLKRNQKGEPRSKLEEEAEDFFTSLFGHDRCPEWCSREAASQIAAIRDYWI
jgi:hypothetical protein